MECLSSRFRGQDRHHPPVERAVPSGEAACKLLCAVNVLTEARTAGDHVLKADCGRLLAFLDAFLELRAESPGCEDHQATRQETGCSHGSQDLRSLAAHCHRLLDDGIVWRSLKSEVAETILKIADDSLIDDWNKQNPKEALGDCTNQPHVCKKPDACRRESALETRWSLSTVLLTKTKCLAWSVFWQIRQGP